MAAPLVHCLFSRPSLHSANLSPVSYLLDFFCRIFPLPKINNRRNFFQKPVKLARWPITLH